MVLMYYYLYIKVILYNQGNIPALTMWARANGSKSDKNKIKVIENYYKSLENTQ